MPPDQSAALQCDIVTLARHVNPMDTTDEASTSPYCEPGILQLPQHSLQHRVPHVKQLFNWDCGLACAMMVLKAVGLHHCDYALLRQLCPTTSIWTIDLAHLLRRFGLGVAFTTITLGPNPAYANESFYSASLQEDERRVSRLFRDAHGAGISVAQRSVGAQELAGALLAADTLVLVLVDKRRLDPWLAAADACLPYALCGLAGSDVVGYTGHYILLVGYDGARGEFLVRDPAGSSGGEPARITPGALDAARKAFGTDEDVLFLSHPALARRAQATQQRRHPQPWQGQAEEEGDLQQEQGQYVVAGVVQEVGAGQGRAEGDAGAGGCEAVGVEQCAGGSPRASAGSLVPLLPTQPELAGAGSQGAAGTGTGGGKPNVKAGAGSTSLWVTPWISWGATTTAGGNNSSGNGGGVGGGTGSSGGGGASMWGVSGGSWVPGSTGWSWGPLFTGTGFTWSSVAGGDGGAAGAPRSTRTPMVSLDPQPAKPPVTC